MLRMGKKSNLSPSEVVEKAVKFFGPTGAGLTVADQGACCARFDGAGGYVFVQTADIDGRTGSDVTVEGREWEHQIKRFMGEI
jgi:hypothetical protein